MKNTKETSEIENIVDKAVVNVMISLGPAIRSAIELGVNGVIDSAIAQLQSLKIKVGAPAEASADLVNATATPDTTALHGAPRHANCARCGAEFIKKGNAQIYCGPNCPKKPSQVHEPAPEQPPINLNKSVPEVSTVPRRTIFTNSSPEPTDVVEPPATNKKQEKLPCEWCGKLSAKKPLCSDVCVKAKERASRRGKRPASRPLSPDRVVDKAFYPEQLKGSEARNRRIAAKYGAPKGAQAAVPIM